MIANPLGHLAEDILPGTPGGRLSIRNAWRKDFGLGHLAEDLHTKVFFAEKSIKVSF